MDRVRYRGLDLVLLTSHFSLQVRSCQHELWRADVDAQRRTDHRAGQRPREQTRSHLCRIGGECGTCAVHRRRTRCRMSRGPYRRLGKTHLIRFSSYSVLLHFLFPGTSPSHQFLPSQTRRHLLGPLWDRGVREPLARNGGPLGPRALRRGTAVHLELPRSNCRRTFRGGILGPGRRHRPSPDLDVAKAHAHERDVHVEVL